MRKRKRSSDIYKTYTDRVRTLPSSRVLNSFLRNKFISAKTNCMYIDPTVPRNHKTIDCLTEIIFRYYGVISLQNHERIS
ncbi:hypothetical protein SLEP1_g26139 [Rubroshorea leprosula]|uniref:Uncharacterized protein n=1 Tax=Rubroshorea leprosula TaxID=152421 RepID=A0AAV5JWR8_9ROSI|nr:hypothetical protein SLEP1_g26139 [Rubroshorea leprosula]